MAEYFSDKLSTDKLIVFVHGVRGHPEETWTNTESEFFWPKEFALDPDFGDFDIYSFGYKSDCSPNLNISEVAAQLKTSLDLLLLEKRKTYHSFSFVGHSMGGLIVRDYILNQHLPNSAIPLFKIINLATPNFGHKGMLINIGKFLCGQLQLKDLRPGRGQYLDRLNDQWRVQLVGPDKEPFIAAGYETIATRGYKIIVEKDSALFRAKKSQAFEKDHSNIAKPENKDDPVYGWVKLVLLPSPPPRFPEFTEPSPPPRFPEFTETQEKRMGEVSATLLEEIEKDASLGKISPYIAQGQFDRALNYLRELKNTKTESLTQIQFTTAQVHELKLDYNQALEYYEKTVALAPDNSLYLNATGTMLNTLGQYDKAIGYYEKALASDLKTFGPEHPNVATLWNNLGSAWDSKGEYDKAIDYYEKALASDLKTFGAEHPKVAIRWNNLGSAWQEKDEYDKAIDYYEKGLNSFLKTFGPEHPNVAIGWNNLGSAWQEKGEYDKAIEYYEKALDSDRKTFGPEHPNVAASWNNLGEAWRAKDEYDKAIDYYGKALQSNLKTFGLENPNVAASWNNLGLAWHSKGEYDKAIGYYEKALKVCKKMGLEHRVRLVEENLKEAREGKK